MESNGERMQIPPYDRSYDRTQDRNRYMVMLPSHERTHVLVEMLPDGSIRLPIAPTSYYYHLQMTVIDLEESISSMFGVKVRYVREIWGALEERKYGLWGETFDMIVVILVEWVEGERSIEGKEALQWMSRNEVGSGNWVEIDKELGLDLREATLKVMKEVNGEIEVRRPPWRRMGWFIEILDWVKDVSKWEVSDDELYNMFAKEVDNHHSVVWQCSLNLSKSNHLHTVAGELESVYIKAAVPLFGEARRTATIAKVLEELKVVPEILAIRENECIVMMRDAGDIRDEGEVDTELLVETIVRMQKLSVDRLEELKAGGLKVRDSEWLLSNIHRILYHESLDKAVADSEEHTKMLCDIRNREEEVRDACKKISKYAIPNTLVHGDLMEFNIGSRKTIGGEGYQFYDWDRSHIGHPFIDIESVTCAFSGDENQTKRWNRAFWKHWKSMGSEEEFVRLGGIVSIVSNCADLDMFLRESELSADEWYGVKDFIMNQLSFVHAGLKRFKHCYSSNGDGESTWTEGK